MLLTSECKCVCFGKGKEDEWSENKRAHFFSNSFSDLTTISTFSPGKTRFLGGNMKRKIKGKEQNYTKQNNLIALRCVLILGFVLYLNCCCCRHLINIHYRACGSKLSCIVILKNIFLSKPLSCNQKQDLKAKQVIFLRNIDKNHAERTLNHGVWHYRNTYDFGSLFRLI